MRQNKRRRIFKSKADSSWFTRFSNTLEVYSDFLIAIGTLLLAVITFIQVKSALQANEIEVQANKTLKTTVYMSLSSCSLDIDKTFVEHSDMWPYFYDGQDINEKNKKYELAESISSQILDYIDTILEERNDFQIEKYPAWGNWMWDIFEGSPLLCRQINDDRDEYLDTIAPFYDAWVEYHKTNPDANYVDWIKTPQSRDWRKKMGFTNID
jgi:hypothetical protein